MANVTVTTGTIRFDIPGEFVVETTHGKMYGNTWEIQTLVLDGYRHGNTIYKVTFRDAESIRIWNAICPR